MKNAVIYTRMKGDTNKITGQGILEKKLKCREFAKKNGYQVVGEYADTTHIGKSRQPNFWQIIENAESGDFQFIIIKCVDRITRNLNDYYDLVKRLRTHGVKLLFVDGHKDEPIPSTTLDWLLSMAIKEAQ